ncbi:MAG: hypothetical protein D6721_08705 [Gammaproteobacteria bacterium]|nr:MAG: hypothetical protein D6721_08705 [Gammaproteobacteria bacterium]
MADRTALRRNARPRSGRETLDSLELLLRQATRAEDAPLASLEELLRRTRAAERLLRQAEPRRNRTG